MATSAKFDDTEDSTEDFRYLIVSPDKGGTWDLLRFGVWGDMRSGIRFLESSNQEVVGGEAADHRWVILVSIIAQKIIHFFSKPMEYTGYAVDFFLNLLSLNGGLFGIFYNLLHGDLVMPRRGTETFISSMGQLDGRTELYHSKRLVEDLHDSPSGESRFQVELGSRALMDLCMMASKLAYENAEVVRKVVSHHWKIHFVDFYNCWDDYQNENSTQVFILSDKPKDANLILVSFRGTEPFDADDWSTDFDYSWYEIPKVGKIHMGFLEALGLGSRTDTASFQNHLQQKSVKGTPLYGVDATTNLSEATGAMSSNTDFDCEGSDSINDDSKTPPDMVKKSAYYIVRRKLKSLLREHKNAKFMVTGHSLGGALAILFPTVLVLHEEMEMMQRLLGVHTFGQPRVGNMQLGKFMEAHLGQPVPKYFRVVYCNDLVPRLPYDDKTFLYKHFGVCIYYDSCYIERIMDEEPNKNFIGLKHLVPEHINAVWELIRGLIMGYTHGPAYKEGWFCILARVIGLALPGVAAHCPTDYVNSIRLGKKRVINMSSS